MPMTAYARLMQMQADIERIKSTAVSRRACQSDERDLLPLERASVGPLPDDALLPGEKEPGSVTDLHPTLN